MFHPVGERATVEPSRRANRKNQSWLDKLLSYLSGQPAFTTQARAVSSRRLAWLKLDVPLLLILIALIIFGAIILASASYDISYQKLKDPAAVFMRQMKWLVVGILGMIVLSFIDYHHWKKLAVPALAVTLIMLIAVFMVNAISGGSKRTLIGDSVQPSELAKLVTVIYLSVWLQSKREQLRFLDFGFIPLAVIIGFIGGLIAIQPDLSAVVTILFLGGVMFFLAGGNMRHIGLFMIATVLVGYSVIRLTGRGMGRLEDYIAGLKNPIDAPDQVVRSFGAFVEGGWFGVGIGNSETKLLGLQVPHTDSIFAVVGAETGVFGSFLLVLLFTLFLWRGIQIARRAPDQLGMLLAGGMTIWLAVEAFINMGVMVNLLPVAGNALPFVSAGGSNLVTSLAAVGILMSVARSSIQTKEEKGIFFNAVVNLRRRDGGRRVPGARRVASPKR